MSFWIEPWGKINKRRFELLDTRLGVFCIEKSPNMLIVRLVFCLYAEVLGKLAEGQKIPREYCFLWELIAMPL